MYMFIYVLLYIYAFVYICFLLRSNLGRKRSDEGGA